MVVERNRRARTLLAAALVAACMLGCADDDSRPAIKWKQGTAMPADFPKDVPVYPNAALKGAMTGENVPTEQGSYIAWTTKDEIPAVRHFYTEKLDDEGWHVISYPGVPAAWMGEGGVTIIATKWGRTASFALAAKDDATMISLVFPGKQQ